MKDEKSFLMQLKSQKNIEFLMHSFWILYFQWLLLCGIPRTHQTLRMFTLMSIGWKQYGLFNLGWSILIWKYLDLYFLESFMYSKVIKLNQMRWKENKRQPFWFCCHLLSGQYLYCSGCRRCKISKYWPVWQLPDNRWQQNKKNLLFSIGLSSTCIYVDMSSTYAMIPTCRQK